jgi:hypothetical protein
MLKSACPRCGNPCIPLLAKAGISAREPAVCPACGAHAVLGPVWGWILAVAAPALFSVLLIALVMVVSIGYALAITLIVSTIAYLGLVVIAPLHVFARR